jgi:hypothetical protein
LLRLAAVGQSIGIGLAPGAARVFGWPFDSIRCRRCAPS